MKQNVVQNGLNVRGVLGQDTTNAEILTTQRTVLQETNVTPGLDTLTDRVTHGQDILENTIVTPGLDILENSAVTHGQDILRNNIVIPGLDTLGNSTITHGRDISAMTWDVFRSMYSGHSFSTMKTTSRTTQLESTGQLCLPFSAPG